MCTFGLILKTDCHLNTYTRRVGLYNYVDLTKLKQGTAVD
jgi:hypothetical protein